MLIVQVPSSSSPINSNSKCNRLDIAPNLHVVGDTEMILANIVLPIKLLFAVLENEFILLYKIADRSSLFLLTFR